MNQRGSVNVVGRRVVVYGPTGSGKTTVARLLGERLGLPVVELDAMFHKPNWQPTPREEFREAVVAQLDRHAEGWVCDGNYGAVRDLVLSRADTAIWLKLPFRVVYWRLLRRTFRRMADRELMWGTNRESWQRSFLSRDSILLWGLTHWRASYRGTQEALRTVPHRASVIELWSAREVGEFMASVVRGQTSHPHPRPLPSRERARVRGPLPSGERESVGDEPRTWLAVERDSFCLWSRRRLCDD